MSVEVQNAVSAPKSLDVKFFENVLENCFNDPNITIIKISFEMGSSGGENYCSQIYRVRITYQRGGGVHEIVSVIVKSIPITDNSRFLADLKVFLKEKIVYFHMLPRMEILLDRMKFGARLYYDCKEPINTLVFEDLSALGYVMADRVKGLDLNHAQLVMKKIGQFHATSMVLHKKDPECMKSCGSGLLAAEAINGSEIYESVYGGNIQRILGLLSKWKGYESIIPKLQRYKANLKQNLIKTQLPIAGELKVLNHGDMWVNNIMFKYTKDKQVEDVVFVDLQMSIYSSPGIDLNYFFYSSLQLDLLKEKREDLLRIYHGSMCEALKMNNYKDIPSFDDILNEVRRREPYGFFTNFGILPTVAMEKAHSADNSIDSFYDDEVLKNKTEIMFSSKRIQETLRYTLKRFDELGVLD